MLARKRLSRRSHNIGKLKKFWVAIKNNVKDSADLLPFMFRRSWSGYGKVSDLVVHYSVLMIPLHVKLLKSETVPHPFVLTNIHTVNESSSGGKPFFAMLAVLIIERSRQLNGRLTTSITHDQKDQKGDDNESWFLKVTRGLPYKLLRSSIVRDPNGDCVRFLCFIVCW